MAISQRDHLKHAVVFPCRELQVVQVTALRTCSRWGQGSRRAWWPSSPIRWTSSSPSFQTRCWFTQYTNNYDDLDHALNDVLTARICDLDKKWWYGDGLLKDNTAQTPDTKHSLLVPCSIFRGRISSKKWSQSLRSWTGTVFSFSQFCCCSYRHFEAAGPRPFFAKISYFWSFNQTSLQSQLCLESRLLISNIKFLVA